MTRLMKRFLSDENGLESVEYAILMALIAVAAIAAITLVGAYVRGTFTTAAGALPAAAVNGG